MPTYEYGCTDCEHEWEEDQSIKAPATEVCPKCSKPTAKRFISRTSFRLVGEGWTPASLASGDPIKSGPQIANTVGSVKPSGGAGPFNN